MGVVVVNSRAAIQRDQQTNDGDAVDTQIAEVVFVDAEAEPDFWFFWRVTGHAIGFGIGFSLSGVSSIFGRPLYAVDNEDLDSAPARIQLQAKLLLYRSENRWVREIREHRARRRRWEKGNSLIHSKR